MPSCNYCDETFDDEDDYLAHLEAAHDGELGAVDRRRVAQATDGDTDDSRATGPLVLGAILVVAVAAAGGVILLSTDGGLLAGDDTPAQPSDVGSVHYHGTIQVVIDGQRLDFSQREYQLQADAFHFEGGAGERWHVHARGVTLGYALSTLGIDTDGSQLSVDGTTYRDDEPGTTVTVTVNGDPVTPSDYRLREGDRVRVVVE